MIKYCPFMNYRKQYHDEIYCMEETCGLWDEERNQCCLKTQALAAAANPPTTPVILQPSPAAVPDASGDWIKPDSGKSNYAETKSHKLVPCYIPY